jgi:drug/metabolite transporter (DMT)-like permease
MGKTFWFWVGWFLFLFCLDFFIPFYLLKNIPKLTGSFIFWVIWIFVAIISMFAIFLKWQENEERTNLRG